MSEAAATLLRVMMTSRLRLEAPKEVSSLAWEKRKVSVPSSLERPENAQLRSVILKRMMATRDMMTQHSCKVDKH